MAAFINNNIVEFCSMNTVPKKVSSGCMSTVLGFIGALIAFLPSSCKSLTEEKEKTDRKIVINAKFLDM